MTDENVNILKIESCDRGFTRDAIHGFAIRLLLFYNNSRGVAEYTLSRHGVHIGRLKKMGNKIKNKIKIIATFNSIIKSV